MGIMIITTAFVIAVIVIWYLKQDYDSQITAIKGKMYRKQNGEFSFGTHIENETLIKETNWLKQSNGGIKPDLFNKKIDYINHLEISECVVPRKGL